MTSGFRDPAGSLRKAELVARWSLFELLWSPRTLAMLVIAATPIGLALVYRLALAFRMAEAAGFSAFNSMAAGVAFPFVAPMLSLLYASGAVKDDIEAGTMPYYLTRPLSRRAFLSGKMLASFTMALGLLLPSLVATYYIVLAPEGWNEIGARFPSLARCLAVAALGLAAYDGIFALAGTLLRKPLIAGLFFIFGWQAVATFVPGRARLLTVAHYLSSLMPSSSQSEGFAGLFGGRSSVIQSLVTLLVIAFVSHGLALAAFSRKEIR
ncbi:MAG: ABC transporter permease [Vicinamibacteria bacterium]